MYEKLKEMMDKKGIDIFMMGVCHLLDIGWRKASKITDEDIEAIKMPENSIMTTGFVQDLTRLAREIAQTCSSVDLIKFMEVEKPYDVKGFKKGR